jgi:hypothetical protein
VKAFISKRAAQAAERIAARWRRDALYPDVFSRELLEAIDLLETTRSPGSPFPTARRPHLKRLLLRKSRCHIYFEIDEPGQMIRILHVWDGRREHPPKL